MSSADDPASWLARADSDLLCIENNIQAKRIPWDAVCFHAQQAAEKALKAVIAAAGKLVPRTHDLLAILEACAEAGRPLDDLRADALLLNPYAIAARYPGIAPVPGAAEGREAAAAAQRCVARIRALLTL